MIKDKIANLILLLNNYGLKREAAELSVIVKKSGIDFRVDKETGNIVVSADPMSLAQALGILSVSEGDEDDEDVLPDGLSEILNNLKESEDG